MLRIGIVLTVLTLGLTSCSSSNSASGGNCEDYQALAKKYKDAEAPVLGDYRQDTLMFNYAVVEAPEGCFPLEEVLKARVTLAELTNGG